MKDITENIISQISWKTVKKTEHDIYVFKLENIEIIHYNKAYYFDFIVGLSHDDIFHYISTPQLHVYNEYNNEVIRLFKFDIDRIITAMNKILIPVL